VIEFARSLAPSTVEKWPVAAVIAEAHAQLKDWARMESLLRASNWEGSDFLRHAYLARALRGEEQKLPSEQELAAAQKEASATPQKLLTLIETLGGWGWQDERVELLWLLAKNRETQLQALQALYEHYGNAGDTPGLYRTLARLSEIRPDDIALENNLAQVCLLLGVDIDRARKRAADLAEKEPGNAAYLSTYAFSLYTNGDTEAALRVMQGLTAEQLQDPSVATYFGIILAGAGQKDRAREFLARSADAHLLPEEKAVVAKATSALQ
jgi:hypothetical protein